MELLLNCDENCTLSLHESYQDIKLIIDSYTTAFFLYLSNFPPYFPDGHLNCYIAEIHSFTI